MERRMGVQVAAAHSESRMGLQPWIASALVHGLALGLAFALVSRLEPLPEKAPFTWDVSLTDPAPSQAVSQSADPLPADPLPSPVPAEEAKPLDAPASPASAASQERPYETNPAVPEVTRPAEVARPSEPTVSVQTNRDIRGDTPRPEEPVQPGVEHRLVEAVQHAAPEQPSSPPAQEASLPLLEPAPPENSTDSVSEPQARVTEPPVPQEMSPIAPKEGQPTSVEAPVAHEHEGARDVPSTADVSPNRAPESTDTTAEAPQQVAKASPAQPALKRSDHRWLADSLWKRVAQLKRYPAAARLNGWEGKVVVRAVIGADGRLLEVKVQKSSGYEALDAAAVEAVRLACPLEMKQALDRPEVAFNLPIVYSLSN